MSHSVSDEAAFILQRREYQDSSLILDLLTENHGRISVLAKAARKRKDSGLFQIGYRLITGWVGQSELKTLTQIEGRSLDVPADCYLAVYYLNELLIYLLPKQDPQSEIFHHYQRTLVSFPISGVETSLRNFEIDLLGLLGLMPDLNTDCHSQKEIQENLNYALDTEAGFFAVESQDGKTISGRDLVAIAARDFEGSQTLASAKVIMRKIIDANLHGRTLQSRQMYQKLKST